MRNTDYSGVRITDGFWLERQKTLREATADAVYDRFTDTHRFSALECTWREGDPHMPHIFWDSDVAKWIEGVAYLLKTEDNPKWRAIIERVTDLFIKNQDADGYFNSHFLVAEKDMRFKERGNHELYCLGHWIEGAVAYFEATGERRLLDAVCRFVDCVERIFKTERSAPFITPGHPELELALVRLWKTTGEARYFDLAKYFIDEHGANAEEPPPAQTYPQIFYNQDDMPVRARKTIEGHSVRALYLLSGMIDVARETNDEELADACKRMFENCTERKMYVTGGVGSLDDGEAFSDDYYLPGRTSYAETCAAISLAMAALRMQTIDENAKYADIAERVMYNGSISGISLDGKKFFYANAHEIDLDFNHVNKYNPRHDRFPKTERVEVFTCSCCPPNILRFIASISGYVLSESDDTVFVNQYMSSESDELDVITRYPADGNVLIKRKKKSKALAVRIPSWCRSFEISAEYELKNGYAFIKSCEDEIKITFDMPIRLVSANRRCHENAGRAAVMRGPVVYCAEGIDNFKDMQAAVIDKSAEFYLYDSEFFVPSIKTEVKLPKCDALYSDLEDVEYDSVSLKLIPYFAYANRGSSDMQIWFLHS
ncbi:MAG: glycoside hydrolase family 127 protein [Clostridia bacterium]|nr:glycoside hydrolase family 127 protein [Clostridia bacterium]